jgi:hypothetical protein
MGGKASRCLATATALLAAMACGGARAQTDDARLRELERRLDETNRALEELKAEQGRAAQAAPPAAEEHEHRMPGAGAIQPPTPLRAFLDVGADFSNHDGENKGFALGSLDFYLTPQLTTNIKAVVELVFEHVRTGDSKSDLERMQIGYTFGDKAIVWVGRFHTPLGYWNTAFHHGKQLQTAVLRPHMIDFEDDGGVLPVHTVGVLGTGATRMGSGRITYDLYAGNAPSIDGGLLDPNTVGREHPGYSVGFNVGYRFGESLDAPKVGVHGYRGDVRDDAVLTNVTRLNILGGYYALDSTAWECIAEYYRFRNEDLSGGRGHFGSWAGFVQLGRRIEAWTPYVRAEKAALDPSDPYFAALSGGHPYTLGALGVRYDLSGNAALKVELNRTRTDDPLTESFERLLLQWAIRF